MNFTDLLTEHQNQCIQRRDYLLKQNSSLPPGKLLCSKSNGYDVWRCSTDKEKGVYIPKSEREFAQKLALKTKHTAELDDLNAEIDACEKYLKHIRIHGGNLEALMAEDNPGFKELLGGISPPEDKFSAWANAPYEKSDYLPEQLRFTTSAGYKVRSKGEVFIAEELFALIVPTRYEEKKKLGNSIVVPDFTVLCPLTGEEKLIEYCGVMNDAQYRARYLEKLRIYMGNGYTPDINILFIHENADSQIDINAIRRKLQNFIFGLA